VVGHGSRDWGIVAVFGVVYLGMFLGGLPRLKLGRSGVALLGAIAFFAFMGVSAQMRLGGFYTAVTRRVARLPLSRSGLLPVLIAVAGALSEVFSNDLVWLAMTPVVARLCQHAGRRAAAGWLERQPDRRRPDARAAESTSAGGRRPPSASR
jgi:Na+/H+ antiporter NhaD/arsenite permease-like protein